VLWPNVTVVNGVSRAHKMAMRNNRTNREAIQDAIALAYGPFARLCRCD
jgi:hypothetical protein